MRALRKAIGLGWASGCPVSVPEPWPMQEVEESSSKKRECNAELVTRPHGVLCAKAAVYG